MTDKTFTKQVTARVNKEGAFHEIIFRGVKGAFSCSMTNETGTGFIENDKVYDVTITESAPESEQPGEALKATDEAAPEKTLTEDAGTRRKK